MWIKLLKVPEKKIEMTSKLNPIETKELLVLLKEREDSSYYSSFFTREDMISLPFELYKRATILDISVHAGP